METDYCWRWRNKCSAGTTIFIAALLAIVKIRNYFGCPIADERLTRTSTSHCVVLCHFMCVWRMLTCVWAHIYKCMCMWRPEANTECVFLFQFSLYLDSFSLTPGSPTPATLTNQLSPGNPFIWNYRRSPQFLWAKIYGNNWLNGKLAMQQNVFVYKKCILFGNDVVSWC